MSLAAWLKLGAVASILLGAGGLYWKGRSDGAASVKNELATQEREAREKADEIRRAADACRNTPGCVLPDRFRLPSVQSNPSK